MDYTVSEEHVSWQGGAGVSFAPDGTMFCCTNVTSNTAASVLACPASAACQKKTGTFLSDTGCF